MRYLKAIPIGLFVSIIASHLNDIQLDLGRPLSESV